MAQIGRYELLRKLGSGGMAEVHLARATGFEGFEKLLVLKRILPHLAADAHFIQMFLAEARLAALLQHPNIVQTYDLGQDGAEFFFTMEFVYGENAYAIARAARKRREFVPYEHAVSIIVGAAAGLHYAHQRVGMDGKPLGIVHRDVSPTNLMVSYDGCPKVADFGIAKVTNRTDVTQAGIRKGKVPYMSPEQCKAQRVDCRSDVFALGICLYELSTGARLFDGDNEFGVMNRIVTGDVPPPSTRRADYPPALERIVMRALAVNLDERYQSCLQMQNDLEAFLRDARLDGSPSALASWMHHVFQPQPFPWGALNGDATADGMARPTLAGSGAGMSSASDGASRPDMTPLSGVGGHAVPSSAHSRVVRQGPGSIPGSYPTTGPNTGSRRTGVNPNDGGTLKGIAMGLGIVAAVAVLFVGGLFIYKALEKDEQSNAASVESPEQPAAAGVVEPEEPAAAPEEPAVTPEEPAAPEEPIAEPEPATDEVEEDPAPEEQDEIEVVEVIDEPEPEPEPEPAPEAEKPKPKPASKPKSRPTPKSRPKPRPKPKKKKQEGADPDAFWGG